MMPVAERGLERGFMVKSYHALCAASALAMVATVPAYAAPMTTASRKPVGKDAPAPIAAVWDGKVGIFDANHQLDLAKLAARYPNGMGQMGRSSNARGAVNPRIERQGQATLAPDAFALWGLDMVERVAPGAFDIMVGFDSQTLQSVTLDIV